MKSVIKLVLIFAVVSAIGCSQEESARVGDPVNTADSPFLLSIEPTDSKPVGIARQSAQDGEAVTLVGHIGGSKEPFVQGLAAFTIVDSKIPYCPPEEGCPTPWDYCCTQNDVKDNIATVKVVDPNGKLIDEDARKLLGVKELSIVVVEGTTKRDDEGNMAVLANKIFIKKH